MPKHPPGPASGSAYGPLVPAKTSGRLISWRQTRAAAIYRLADLNEDGDALDPSEVGPVVDGLTAATDVTFTDTGWLLTTELSLAMAALYADLTPERAAEFPGRVTARCGPDSVVVADDISTPTSVVAVGDLIVVAEEFAGRVTQLDPVITPWDQLCTAWRDAP